ncbi:MAG: FAD-linked oxidase C-terminal domain-containing protein [Desulfohalobiaceae bacterium]
MLQAEARNRLINILGEDNFADNQEELIAYSFDATKRQALPEAVVFPSTVEQVAQVLALANQERIPVVPRGAGSGMSGGSVPVHGGIVLVLQGFDRILELDADNLVAVVQPGVVTQKLQQAAQEKGLFYPPDPASMAFSSIGGNIAENSGGLRAVKYGVTRDYVLGLEVVLPNGQIIQTGSKCIKDVVGYNLTQLFVGSEGTLGVITQAILRLLPLPKASQTLSATFPSMLAAANTVSEVLRQGLQPTAMEFLDRASIWSVSHYLDLGLPEKTQAFLLVELDGDPDLIQKNIQQVQEVCMSNQALQVNIAADKKEQEELWRARRSVSASLAHHGAVVKLNEDIVVPRASLPEMITAIEEMSSKSGILIANFGHAGDGNIHVNVLPKQESLDQARQAVRDIFAKTVELGGRISGEHGIGLSKKEYIQMNLQPSALDLMRSIKQAVDPCNILNPGKILPNPE